MKEDVVATERQSGASSLFTTHLLQLEGALSFAEENIHRLILSLALLLSLSLTHNLSTWGSFLSLSSFLSVGTVERVKYLLRMYLRCRLKKIEV
jgi:hypothetical protein